MTYPKENVRVPHIIRNQKSEISVRSYKLTASVSIYFLSVLTILILSISPCTAAQHKKQEAALATATTLYEKGKYEPAIAIYNKIIKQHGKNGYEAMYQKGQCLFSMKKFQEAIDCWEKQLRRYKAAKNNDRTVINIASTYAFSLHQHDQGIKTYQTFFKEFHKSPLIDEAKYQYAGIFMEQYDFKTAHKLLADFIKTYPQSIYIKKANYHLQTCEQQIKQEQVEAITLKQRQKKEAKRIEKEKYLPKSKKLLKQADDLYQMQEFNEALPIYQSITRGFTSKEHAKAYYRLGKCYQKKGKNKQAIKCWEKVMHIPAMFSSGEYKDDALTSIADTLFDNMNDSKNALKNYQAVLNKYPATKLKDHIYAQMATIYIINGEADKAKIFLTKAIANQKKDPNAPPTGLERLLESCNKPNAFLMTRETIKNNKFITAKMHRADIYFTAKNYKQAVEIYNEITKKVAGTENAAYALMQSARCYNMLRKYKKALKQYNKFLTRYKKSDWADDALLRAGVIYVGPLNKMKKGIELFKLILKLYPNSNEAPTAAMYLATLTMWQEQWEKSLMLHKQILNQYPDCKFIEFIKQIRLPEIEAKVKEIKKQKGKKK